MSVNQLFSALTMPVALFVAILTFGLVLKYFAKGYAKELVFKFWVFVAFSVLALLSSNFLPFISDPDLNYYIRVTIQIMWWFSMHFFVIETLNYFVWDRWKQKKGITASKLLRDLVSFGLKIVTLAAVFHFVLQKSVVGLFTASGVMAIILGYSAQASLSDAFSGISLNLTKQFDLSDWVTIGKVYGKVVDINWRFVCLLTIDGDYLSIPNSVVSKEWITNYSKPSRLHGVTITVPVNKDFAPDQVKSLLFSAAKESFKVNSSTEPCVSLIEIGPSNNIYQLTYYTIESRISSVTDDVLSIFWYMCRRAGIIEPNIISKGYACSDEDKRKFLAMFDLFKSFTEEELNTLAGKSTPKIYGPPEKILTQGQQNQSLFLIYKGGVDGYIKAPDGSAVKAVSLGEGGYFGEMSILTGDPASASIVVNSESLIIEITHETMADLLKRRPELVEQISTTVIKRKMMNETLRNSLKVSVNKDETTLIKQLADKIKGYFIHAVKKDKEDDDHGVSL